VLWGLLTGSVVHTTMLSRHHTTHGGRASSLIVQCEPSEAHEGEVCDIWAPEVVGETTRWVTGGADGRVKYWQLNPGQQKSGKRSRAVESVPGSLTCLFTSKIVEGSLGNRSDAVKRRQTGAPDAIILARCHVKHGVLCGVTEDGVLRLWFGVETANPKEVRVDVGAKESFGSVRRMELDVGVSPAGLVASVLVHHDSAPSFLRYDISDLEVTDGETIVRTYSTSHSAVIATLLAHLTPTPSISLSPRPLPALSTNITSPHDSPETLSPPPLDLPPVTETLQSSSHFGRYVAAGDQNGMIYIWSWDSAGAGYCVKPLRAWSAMTGKITTIDVSCGLVGVGRYVIPACGSKPM